jgi:hypothetical protein
LHQARFEISHFALIVAGRRAYERRLRVLSKPVRSFLYGHVYQCFRDYSAFPGGSGRERIVLGGSLRCSVVRVLMRTRSFWLFAAVGFAELGALLLLGETTMTPTVVVVIAVLVLWLGRGSRVAWWLFVAANSFALLGTLGIAISSSTNGLSGGTDWGNITVICVGSVVLLMALLSPAMRRPPPASCL